MTEPLLSCKELATALNRSMPYIYQMKKRGFRIRSGRATLTAALNWLEKHPCPTSKRRQLSKV